MRTSAPVALWWKRGLLNHTAEPLQSLAVGFSQSGDQTSLGTLLRSEKKHWPVASEETGQRSQSRCIFNATKLPLID